MNTSCNSALAGLLRPVAAAALLLASGWQAPALADERAMDAARGDYEVGHYQRAFEQVAVLADGGHCEAARLAREMVRHGPQLYARRFEVAADRLARWQTVPRCAARPPAVAAVATP